MTKIINFKGKDETELPPGVMIGTNGDGKVAVHYWSELSPMGKWLVKKQLKKMKKMIEPMVGHKVKTDHSSDLVKLDLSKEECDKIRTQTKHSKQF